MEVVRLAHFSSISIVSMSERRVVERVGEDELEWQAREIFSALTDRRLSERCLTRPFHLRDRIDMNLTDLFRRSMRRAHA